MAMIASARNPPWPQDTAIADLDAASLPAASVVRMKLFTLDHRFVLAKCGRLADKDRKSVAKALAVLLGG